MAILAISVTKKKEKKLSSLEQRLYCRHNLRSVIIFSNIPFGVGGTATTNAATRLTLHYFIKQPCAHTDQFREFI